MAAGYAFSQQQNPGTKSQKPSSGNNTNTDLDNAPVQQSKVPKVEGVRTFKTSELESHFNKHGQQVANALSKSNYSIQQYLDDANNIIQNGTYIPEMNGYVVKIGGTGKSTKYAFVGLDRATGNITTYHVKYAKQILKKSPNFEVNP